MRADRGRAGCVWMSPHRPRVRRALFTLAALPALNITPPENGEARLRSPASHSPLGSLQPERICAAAAVRVDAPAVIAGSAGVSDLLGRGRALRDRDGAPKESIPLLQIEIEVGVPRALQPSPVRAGHRAVVIRAVRLVL